MARSNSELKELNLAALVEELRATKQEAPNLPFRNATGQLDSPATAAAKVLRYLDRPDFGSVPVADVRDA